MSEGAPRILLGVTGSIAAYKAVEIARLFVKAGAEVQVAMTQSATAFVGPLTFEATTSRPVLTDVLAVDARRGEIEHVERAHEVDLLVVAPASANTIAKLAVGLAGDPLTAIALSTSAPRVVVPAMETGMWNNPATRANVATLESRGWVRIGPTEGALASGRTGAGRMVEPEDVVRQCLSILSDDALAGWHVLVTAGPTWEAIDPVRVLTNRSTGAMGIAIAEAAARRGATVTLVLGPTHLPPPSDPRVTTRRVESAVEMLEAARGAGPADLVIGTAAVSDFRPADAKDRKLKRSAAEASTLALVENPDVLATLSEELRSGGADPIVVGFAAETEDVVKNARKKLETKRCDLVIGNVVGRAAGFGGGDTEVVAVSRTTAVPFGPAPKRSVADFVLDQVVRLGEERTDR